LQAAKINCVFFYNLLVRWLSSKWH